MSSISTACRGAVLHFVDDPARAGEAACEYWDDGLLWIENGRVRAVGAAAALLPALPADVPRVDYGDYLIVPGFVDAHVHYPQTEMIAAYGEQLLQWLENYTYPVEQRFADADYAHSVADFFLDELLRNGTTTALVFATVHPVAVDAFFEAAQQRELRMISGKVLMDRNAPAVLCDTAAGGVADSRALIERWHGVGRLQYALMPRFAASCSEQQLQLTGQLLGEYPGVYLHTHLAENRAESAWVRSLFPGARNYLDIYDSAALLGRRSVFAHGIHLADDECARLAQSDSALVHCPSSNLFLGSGLFDLHAMQRRGIRVGVGTDIGAGTSFSLLSNLGDAYKVQQLRGETLDPLQALYLATLGGARALDLDTLIGNFAAGKEADFTVLDMAATPLLRFRMAHCRSLRERLFVLNTLGDDRVVRATYVLGGKRYDRAGSLFFE